MRQLLLSTLRASSAQFPLLLMIGMLLATPIIADLPEPYAARLQVLTGLATVVLLFWVILLYRRTEELRATDKEELRAHRAEIVEVLREGKEDRKRLLEGMKGDMEEVARLLASHTEERHKDISQKLDLVIKTQKNGHDYESGT